jgi:hypothetical protein
MKEVEWNIMHTMPIMYNCQIKSHALIDYTQSWWEYVHMMHQFAFLVNFQGNI